MTRLGASAARRVRIGLAAALVALAVVYDTAPKLAGAVETLARRQFDA